jgi:hypothetical protein
MNHLLKSVKQHPEVVALGTNSLEQGRIDSFAVDLAYWLAGDSVDSLGILGRLILMVVGEELTAIRTVCDQQPRIAISSAALITRELWPLLRDSQKTTPLSLCPNDQRPLLELLRECSQLDVPELLNLASRIATSVTHGQYDIESTARKLMNGIPQTALLSASSHVTKRETKGP